MRTWFWTLLLAVVAVALAVVLRSHSGNVLLLVWPWRIEMSLTLAVLLIVAAFVVLYVGLRVLAWLLAIPDRVRSGAQRARRATTNCSSAAGSACWKAAIRKPRKT